MSGFKQQLGLPVWEDLVRYAAGCRGALSALVGGGETPWLYLGSWETLV